MPLPQERLELALHPVQATSRPIARATPLLLPSPTRSMWTIVPERGSWEKGQGTPWPWQTTRAGGPGCRRLPLLRGSRLLLHDGLFLAKLELGLRKDVELEREAPVLVLEGDARPVPVALASDNTGRAEKTEPCVGEPCGHRAQRKSASRCDEGRARANLTRSDERTL